MKELITDFNQFISLRMENIADQELAYDPEYQHLLKQCQHLFEQLGSIIEENHCSILNEYEQASTLVQGMSERIMYYQGLKDGFKLHQELWNS